eukprot:g11448.t1
MESSMDTEDLLSMSLDQMIASKPKKTRDGEGGGRGGRRGSGGGGGKARTTGRASRQQQSQPYHRQSAPAHSVGGAFGNSKVYVGNLAWSVTWKELKDLMSTCGPCQAEVGVGANGRSKGYGVVTFNDPADATTAINSLQDTDLMGRPIFLREFRDDNGSGPANGGSAGGGFANCKVFVSNLSYDVQWQDLKDHMRNAGSVIRADVIVGLDGRSKGLGTVEFSKPYEAKNAISQLAGTELMGRPINVREDRGDAVNLGRGVGGAAGAKVYVGNLSWDVQWQDLKDHMRMAGNVKFVDLFQEPGGRSKGCAVVEYETAQEAHAAIRDLHDTDLMGRLIFVREDREEGSAASKSMGQLHEGAEHRQVFVKNLNYETGWQSLKDHFKQVGYVQFVEIPEDAQGRSKGRATVRFASEQDAANAVYQLNNTELDGRTIYVREGTNP